MLRRYYHSGINKKSTEIISGGYSYDSLGDEYIDKISPTIYSIQGAIYTYEGGENIPVNLVNKIGYVMLTKNGLLIDDTLNQESILLATFKTNSNGHIIEYNIDAKFNIIKDVYKLNENFNIILNYTEPIKIENNIVTLNTQFDILLLSNISGVAIKNTVQPFSLTLNNNEMLYVKLNRNLNTNLTVNKKSIFSDVLIDEFVLVICYDNKYISKISSNVMVYSNSNPTSITVGGIPAGTILNNINFNTFIDMLLYPEMYPVLTNPSLSFVSNAQQLYEVGSVIPSITFTATFDRGSINPQYTATSPYRSGLPYLYEFTGTGLTNEYTSDLIVNKTITNYTVIIGTQSFSAKVHYNGGVQPKTNKNNNYDSPLPAGSTQTKYVTITGVYPYFATTSNIADLTKQPLQLMGTNIQIQLVAEDGINKQTIQIPFVWGTLNKIEQFNELTNKWEEISMSTFTITNIVKTINNNDITYVQYKYNGSTIGQRNLRFIY